MGGPAVIDGEYVESTDNFLQKPMQIEGFVGDSGTLIEWPTCEHFFQAVIGSLLDIPCVMCRAQVKFDTQKGGKQTQAYIEEIKNVSGAGAAWSMGQSRQHPLRHDWEDVKANAMYIAVKAKFTQHPTLAEELTATHGGISAAPSTSNWQQLNSVVLERVREELCIAAGEPRASAEQYAKWVSMTRLPEGAAPLVIRFTTEPVHTRSA